MPLQPQTPRRTHRLIHSALAALLVALAAGLLCGDAGAIAASEAPSADPSRAILRLGWTHEPDSLNPFVGCQASSREVWALTYDVLVGVDPTSETPTPGRGLATNWTTSPNGRVWTFTITDKATWHDGRPLTARDVAFTYTYCIKNRMSAFADDLAFVERAEAPDATHVVIRCSQPKADLLSLSIPILPAHLWGKLTPQNAGSTYRNAPPIVGSGPFKCVSWRRGSSIRMVANTTYWRGAPKVDEIVFEAYRKPDMMAKDLESGALAGAWNIPYNQFEDLRNKEELSAIACVGTGVDYLGVNCSTSSASKGHPALRDVRFRRALNFAINKERLLRTAYDGFGRLGTGLIQSDYYPRDTDYHWEPKPDARYSFDPERAKRLLDAAGYLDSDDDGVREYRGNPIELRLWAVSGSASSKRAGKLIANWLTDIGLKIDFGVLDAKAVTAAQYNFVGAQKTTYAPDFDLFLWGWSGNSDPNYLLSVMTTEAIGKRSDCAWSNATYDELFRRQRTTLDVHERVALVHRMQQIVSDESPYIVLVYPDELEAYNTEQFTGWQRTLNGRGKAWFDTQSGLYLGIKRAGGEAETSTSLGLIVGIIAGCGAALGVAAAALIRRHH